MESQSALTCASHFALCTYIQGVEFTFRNPAGENSRAVVLAEALESRYGAHSNASAWLAAFERNQSEIVAEARRLSTKASRPLVLIAMLGPQSPEERGAAVASAVGSGL